MRAVNYFLLIVESPTIKKSIEALEISGLEVISTSGYAWIPVADPKTGKLKARSNPDSAGFRKDLRDKALLASRIVIAMDSDPSGQFLAHAITVYLNRDDRITYGTITSIDRTSVESMLNKSTSRIRMNPDLLARYFTARTLLQRYIAHQTGSSASLAGMLAAGMKLMPFQTSDFISESGAHFRSTKPFETEATASFNTDPITDERTDIWKPTAHPVSTAILPWIPDTRFEDTQNRLNRLFTNRIDELDGTLISYPRTELTGYFQQTWNFLCEQYIRLNGAEELLPQSMRYDVTAEQGHEALHIRNLEHNPHSVRPYLKKEDLDLFTLIYDATLASLKRPEKLDKETCFTDESHIFFPSTAENNGDAGILKPIQCLDRFSQALFDTGWVKPSALGKTLDSLLEDKWIEIEALPVPHVKPGEALHQLDDKSASIALLLAKKNRELYQIAMKTEEPGTSWRTIFADCLKDS